MDEQIELMRDKLSLQDHLIAFIKNYHIEGRAKDDALSNAKFERDKIKACLDRFVQIKSEWCSI